MEAAVEQQRGEGGSEHGERAGVVGAAGLGRRYRTPHFSPGNPGRRLVRNDGARASTSSTRCGEFSPKSGTG